MQLLQVLQPLAAYVPGAPVVSAEEVAVVMGVIVVAVQEQLVAGQLGDAVPVHNAERMQHAGRMLHAVHTPDVEHTQHAAAHNAAHMLDVGHNQAGAAHNQVEAAHSPAVAAHVQVAPAHNQAVAVNRHYVVGSQVEVHHIPDNGQVEV